MAEGYSQVFSDVDFKRLEVLADFTEQRDRIFESVPEIKDIEEEIRTLGADSARAIIKKDDGKKAEIKKKIEALRKKEKALLKAAGYPENALVPYPVIVVATKGDPDAMKIVLQHFSGYIARLSMRKLYDERGNVYFGVDHDIRERLQAKLMMAVLTFKAEE